MERCYNRKFIRNLKFYESIIAIAKKDGVDIQSKIVKKEVLESNRYISKCLEIPLATKVFYIKRIYSIDSNVILIENSWIPYMFTRGINEEQWEIKSLYECLKDTYGIHLKERNEELRIVRTTEEECEIFKLTLESQLLMMRGSTKDSENRTVEYFENFSLPSVFEFKE